MSLLSRMLCWPYVRFENEEPAPYNSPFCYPTRRPDAERYQYQQDLDLYPITDSYFVSEYTQYITSRMILHHPSGQKLISICLGPEGADFAQPQYLRRVEAAMIKWSRGYDGVLPAVNAAIGLPKNTISVSIAERKFSCGDDPHVFIYNNPKPRDTFLTYQMLRDGFQITHFNHVREVSVPAGSVFFVQSNGKKHELEKKEITMSITSTACENGYRWVRTIVDEKAMKWPTRSYLVEPVSQAVKGELLGTTCYAYALRPNINLNFPAYIHQIIKGYPKTDAPYLPDILAKIVASEKIKTTNGRPVFGFKTATKGAVLANPLCLEMIEGRLLGWFKQVSAVKEYLDHNPLPRNTVAVSMALNNFKLGPDCNDFWPGELKELPAGAYFVYQKLSENLQATFYNDNGVEFLAGLCYYPETGGHPELVENDRALIYLALASADYWPRKKREKCRTFKHQQKYGRYCTKAGRRVVVEADSQYGVGRHFDYDHLEMKFVHVSCDECLKDFLEGEDTHQMRVVLKKDTDSVVYQPVLNTVAEEDDEDSKKNN
uniref:Piwi domain-containing protein n=1 Tax=Caenorhabditis tropicalis TaxID=1561998 RepID=A0A1I7TBM6_9PELO